MKAGLLFLLGSTLLVGVWALLAPRSFFDDFPALGMTWISPLPKYNEHLIRDVGGLNLGYAVLFGWAFATLERRIIQVGSIAWLFFALPHLGFHLFHLDKLTTNEAVLQTVVLALLVIIPIVLLVRTGRQDRWAIQNTGRWSSRR